MPKPGSAEHVDERPRLHRGVRPPSLYLILSLGVFGVAAYLSFVNLDYVALWHDEAPTAILGNTLLERGIPSGWDGRNLVGGVNGRTLNADLIDTLPPLAYVLDAFGIALFGFNEVGARIMHALAGVLSLGFLYLLLREHLQKYPRLVFFMFVFAAWSAQLLLYFRQSRYYAFMVLGVVAAFYLYERYWRTRTNVHLVLLTLVATLSFFNHYVAGAATMLSVAAWHMLFRAKETTRREYLRFGLCSLIVVVVGTGYLVGLGVVHGERSGWLDFMGMPIRAYAGGVPLPLLRTWTYARDVFAADWISWPVFLWFAGMLMLAWRKNWKAQANDLRLKTRGLPLVEGTKIFLMGGLFALFSALLSVQPVWVNPISDLRYCVGALPLVLTMKGLFVEWTWRRSKIAGIVAAVILLFTSIGAAPFNIVMVETGERTLGAHLLQFVREIHRPYRDAVQVVSQYLLQHAEKEDLVYVPKFAYREPLTFYAGHHVRFCCALNEMSPLPRSQIESLGAPLYVGEHIPDWIILFGEISKEHWEEVVACYDVVAEPAVYHRLTQRPELNYHAFTPLTVGPGVHILRLKTKRPYGVLPKDEPLHQGEHRNGQGLLPQVRCPPLDLSDP